MDKKELNQLFGVHIMGLIPGVDFGEWPAHKWKTRRDADPEEYAEDDPEGDEIDTFAMDYGYHNGPGCARCGYSYCQHCKPEPDEPCEKEVPDYIGSARQVPHIIKKLHELDDELRIQFDLMFTAQGDKPRVTITDANGLEAETGETYTEALVMAALRWKGVLE